MATLRVYPLLIKVGESIPYAIRGDTLRVLKANVPIYFDSQNDDLSFYLEQGEEAQLNGVEFKQMDISHKELTDQLVTIAVSKGARIGSTKVAGSISINNANGAYVQTQATVTNGAVVAIKPANAGRKYLLIQNNDAAAAMRITFDGSNPTATKGIRVRAGGTLELSGFNCTSIIKAIMEIAASGIDNIEILEG